MDGITRVCERQHHFAVAANDRQEIIEVVGYAGSQTPDRVHLLCLAQLYLLLPLLPDVAADSGEMSDFAKTTAPRDDHLRERDDASIAGSKLRLTLPRAGSHCFWQCDLLELLHL